MQRQPKRNSQLAPGPGALSDRAAPRRFPGPPRLQEALPRTARLGSDQDLNAQGWCSAIVYYVERDL